MEDLEDHMIFRETEDSGYMKILQSLDWGEGGGYFHRATTKILPPLPPSAVNYNWYQSNI